VNRPEGKKYLAARHWGVRTVSIEWLDQTVERGMILDERLFDPSLPLEERGKGAWSKRDPRRLSLGKRSRSSAANSNEEGKRKIRKTASMKLNSQRDTLWGDILGRRDSYEAIGKDNVVGPAGFSTSDTNLPQIERHSEQSGPFSACHFSLYGFDDRKTAILSQTIQSLGGTLYSSLEQEAQLPIASSNRFLVVPQDSQPDTHPVLSENVDIVTEFFIEKCLHGKRLINPTQHCLGRPFPRFPIVGFEALTICTAGFDGVDLLHIEKSVRQLGAKYDPRFHSKISVLVCKSLAAVRKEKLKLALDYPVPVISADWLWECIQTGFNVPIANFAFPELKQEHPNLGELPLSKHQAIPALSIAAGQKTVANGYNSDGPSKTTKPNKLANATISDGSCNFVTAMSRQENGRCAVPLTDLTPNDLNKSPSPQKLPRQVEVDNYDGTLEDDSLSDTKRDACPQVTSLQNAEESPGRLEDERERAEHLALSTKLATLINVTSAVEMSSHDTSHEEDSAFSVVGAKHHQRRRRAILGRATSNASVGSAGSGESAARAGIDGSKNTSFSRRQGTGSFDVTDTDAFLQEETHESVKPPPPPTQIDYQDPEAQQHKAALMSKIMGHVTNDPVSSVHKSNNTDNEKLTLADLQGLKTTTTSRSGRPLRRRQ
jgi:DNA replication regulator DPB11